MSIDFGAVSFYALALSVIAAGLVVCIGIGVVVHYPDRNDVRRTDRRYVLPALILAVICAVAFLVSLFSGAIAIGQAFN